MKPHGLLLQCHVGGAQHRRHDGKIAVVRSNLCWCSDGFKLACDNGEKVRIAFALDCCDREAMASVATTRGIEEEDVRLPYGRVRCGSVNCSPQIIKWLSDNGSGYIAKESRGSGYIAKETRAFARGIGLEPLATPVTSTAVQWNG